MIRFIALYSVLSLLGVAMAQETSLPYLHAKDQVIENWQALRFGMFIHWGPNCQKGGEIGWSRQGPRRGRSKEGTGNIPMEIYDNLYKTFNPVQFNADEWVKIAKDAGMKYMVITAKHHDGFSMFDSTLTEYDIMSTPFARDVVGELAKACKAGGIKFGTYYSPRDWYHPDFATERHDQYLAFYMGQLEELVTKYKPLMVLWFDGLDSPRELWKDTPERSFELLRRLQPDIILNNRGGLPGDYDTPEQRIGGFNRARPWETCMTIGNQWSWKPDDQIKSLKQCIQTLLRVVGGDGNLLFNVGPRPDGRIEPDQVERLREMGTWLEKYGEAVCGTRGGPFRPGQWGASTCKGDKISLFIMTWPKSEPLMLPGLSGEVLSAKALSGGEPSVKQLEDSISVSLSEKDRDDIATVIELTMNGPAFDMATASVDLYGTPIKVKGATASNVYQGNDRFAAGKAIDGDNGSRWATDADTHAAWLELALENPSAMGGVHIREAYAGRVQAYELQEMDGNGWTTFHQGTDLGEDVFIVFEPVIADKVKLNITSATEGPTLWEVELFAPKDPKTPVSRQNVIQGVKE